MGCLDAAFFAVRMAFDGSRVSFIRVKDGLLEDLVWPRGFSAWAVGRIAELVAPDGTIIARAGGITADARAAAVIDRLGGVYPFVCSINGKDYPPSA